MTNHELVRSYIPMAEFIAALVGSSCEVVLHDLEDVARSVVYISGGSLSGRTVGDGLIDFAIDDGFRRQAEGSDYALNLPGHMTTKDGDRIRCSAYFIKDRKGKPVGFIGVNQNVSELYRMEQEIRRLLNIGDGPEPGRDAGAAPDRAISADVMVNGCIDDALRKVGCADPGRITKEQRREVIEILAERNLFIIKGCVSIVAQRLGMSVPSIYRLVGETKEG